MEQNTWPRVSAGHAFSTIPTSSSSAPPSSSSSTSTPSLSSSTASRWRDAMELDWQQITHTNNSCISNINRDNPHSNTGFIKDRASSRGRKDRKLHSPSSSGCGETKVKFEEHGVNISRHIRSLLSSPHTSQSRNSNPKHPIQGHGSSSSPSSSCENCNFDEVPLPTNPNLYNETSPATNPNPAWDTSSSHQLLFPSKYNNNFGPCLLHQVLTSSTNPNFGSSISHHQVLLPKSPDFGTTSTHDMLLPTRPNISTSLSNETLSNASRNPNLDLGVCTRSHQGMGSSKSPNFGVCARSQQVVGSTKSLNCFGRETRNSVEEESKAVMEKPYCFPGGREPRDRVEVSREVLETPSLSGDDAGGFVMLPDDILLRVAGAFSWPNLWAATMVCRSWAAALAPLREAMLFVHWGKKFKHGRSGVSRNLDKALDSFLKGATRGCTAAMVDAGLLLWETGRRQEGVYWYKKAAELGDSAGQCNLGLAYLQEPANPTEAVMWFRRAAFSGHVRAQYSLALCLQQGRGVECSASKAARWYQRAAEGGSARAMYNLAICYRKGEGINGDLREARKWMKRAALSGHRKAQFEHGLTLFAESDGGLALVFLELATRAGETAATHLRDALLQQLSPKMRTYAISCADKWQAKLNARV